MSTPNQPSTPTRTVKIMPVKTASYFACASTCIGGRKENQDSMFIKSNPSTLVCSVCDGMGGMNGGAIASGLAVMSMLEAANGLQAADVSEELLKNFILDANTAVYTKAASDQTLLGMGTTATLLIITKEAAWLAHVGDSRIYQIRDGKKIYRTFDHSRVFELVEAGVMTEEDARNSNFSNVITRALGIRPRVEVSLAKVSYKKGDRFILCCDGIWNCLPEKKVINMFDKHKHAVREADFLIESIDAIGKKKGGDHDNMTVAIIDMKEDSDYQTSSPGWFTTFFSHFKK